MSAGRVIIRNVNGVPRIEQADPHIEITNDLIDQLRREPTEWARVDDDRLTIHDLERTYTYRVTPHSPLTYAGELVHSAGWEAIP